MSQHVHWWQRGIIYQIYPRSFLDSNGDGVGDLNGITSRLDYVRWLGVDAIWISPIYPSPMVDFGYDITDYTGVHPLFGTLQDLERLIAEAHRRELRVILDFVPNHSSDQHPWFQESRSGRHSPRRDWYIWRDPAPDGGPPNNWRSVFGGSAWEYDQASGQYYYHAFLKQQPDLNWRNPQVEAAMFEVLRFWLERGVDGFRVDALRHLIKDSQFRDNPPNLDYDPRRQGPFFALLPDHSTDQPEIHTLIARMRGVLDEYPERVMIGELYLPIERLVRYYGDAGRGCQLPFNFQLISQPWNAQSLASIVAAYEAALPGEGWPNWVLGNHDVSRIASRVGQAQARVAAMLLLTLRGTPTLYYGDEIGMRDVPIAHERVQDPYELNVPGMGLGRDPERSPMQWDGSPRAGFSTAEPWLPLAEDSPLVNVALQRDDPSSMLTLHHRLIALRASQPALAVGSYRQLAVEGDVLAYLRAAEDRRFVVVLNLGSQPHTLEGPGLFEGGRIVLSTQLDREEEPVSGRVALRGDEGLVIALQP